VKTFHGHIGWVNSVSISAKHTTIASGSYDRTIRLWDIQTGKCYHIIEQQANVRCVRFSPIHSQYFISVCNDEVEHWSVHGHQINPSQSGSCVAFSVDGTQLVLCQEADIVVQNTTSEEIVARFYIPHHTPSCCCFSPDDRLVAVAAENTVYIWDITGSDPLLIGTFIGHTARITSLVFSSPSSLISSSFDQSVKFWQFGTPSTDQPVGHPNPTLPASAPIKSITLHAKHDVFVSSDLDGIVRTWDISTGLCKTSLQTPANIYQWDVQLVDSRLILVWYASVNIHIWDVEKEMLLQTIDTTWGNVDNIRISGDGSKVFCLRDTSIKAWSTWTGEVVGKAKVEASYAQTSLITNGSRVWVYSPYSPACNGWDFGIPGSSPVQLPLLYLSDTKLWDTSLSRVKDIATRKVVFQLGGRFAKPDDVQLDGQYFLAHYQSGEALILDFNHVLLW